MEFHFRFQKGFSPTSDLYFAIRCENVAKTQTPCSSLYILSCAIKVLIDIIWIKHNRHVFVNVKIWIIIYLNTKLNMWLQQNRIRFGEQTHPKQSSMSISLTVTKKLMFVSYTNLNWCHLNVEIKNIWLNILISHW